MDHMQSFGSLSLGSRLRRLSDRLVQDVADLYRSQGIELSPTYFPLFNLIRQQGAMTVTEAAEKLGVSHPAISKIARKMLAEEWISKVADPDDERRQMLLLTPKSEALVIRVEPIWREVKGHLDTLMDAQQYPLLNALAEFEQLVDQRGFYQPVLQQLQQQQAVKQVSVTGWDSRYRADFSRLNLDWLNRFFDGELTERDREALDNPEGFYLARGGYIWFALNGQGEVVGCVALARHENDLFEISKMGVDECWQSAGVGRQLLLAALDKAREQGAERLYLETSSKLIKALALYRNMGFREQAHPAGKSYYDRSDIYMTLAL